MFEKGHTFIIAEIGSNHNQDIHRAFELMELAKEAGADAVKFQSLQLGQLMDPQDITEEDVQLFEQIKLEEDWYERLFSYAKNRGIECISSPTYLEAVSLLKKCGSNCIKIASPQTYGFPALIKAVARTGIPTLMSTGYCDDAGIDRAVRLFKQYGDERNLTLLHCISQYPVEIQNVNLQYMIRLKERYQLPVGYSDHTLGNTAACAAVAMGAAVIEKHITLSRDENGPDHFFASEPGEFAEMVRQIRIIEQMQGTGEKELTEFETEFRESINMYPYAARNMQEGECIAESDITWYRSRQAGISPWEAENHLQGSRLTQDIQKGEKFKKGRQ